MGNDHSKGAKGAPHKRQSSPKRTPQRPGSQPLPLTLPTPARATPQDPTTTSVRRASDGGADMPSLASLPSVSAPRPPPMGGGPSSPIRLGRAGSERAAATPPSIGNNNNFSTSLPCYTDARTTIFPSPNMCRANNNNNAATHGDSSSVRGPPTPLLLGASARSQSNDFVFGTSYARRSGAGGGGGAVDGISTSGGVGGFSASLPTQPLVPTEPIIIPSYNPSPSFGVIEHSSPMLRSYRHHDFAQSSKQGAMNASPTSPCGRSLQQSVAGSSPWSGGGASSHFGMYCGNTPSTTPLEPPTSRKWSTAEESGEVLHREYLTIGGKPHGLENYGNTCYFNSVIQLIYHCSPLRIRLLELRSIYVSKKGGAGFDEHTLLFHLCELMEVMHRKNNGRKVGSGGSGGGGGSSGSGANKTRPDCCSPQVLLDHVRRTNEAFNNAYQHDAHEFAMFLLNDIMETEKMMMKDPKNRQLFADGGHKHRSSGGKFSLWGRKRNKESNDAIHTVVYGASPPRHVRHTSVGSTEHPPLSSREESVAEISPSPGGVGDDVLLSPLQAILQGTFASLRACLSCEHISARQEVFFDVSVETRQGSSLLHCLQHFSDPEYFWGANQLQCESCHAPRRSAITLHISQLPEYALMIHLKRQRYDTAKGQFSKKSDHVALPMEMDLEEWAVHQDDAAAQGSPTPAAAAAAAAPPSPPTTGAAAASVSDDVFVPMSADLRRRMKGVAHRKARFALTAFVAHVGEGPNVGHYFTCVKYGPQLWRRFDDEVVTTLSEREVEQHFGVPIDLVGVITTTAYLLLYERIA